MQELLENDSTLEASTASQGANQNPQPNLFDWADEYILTDDEIKAISEPEWIIENLIISGHVILIPAEPNAGKTTIFFHLAGEMIKQGHHVYYVNTDISGGDAKPLASSAKDKGINLLLPDMKLGLSMQSVIAQLTKLSEANESLNNTVFIFDTLKKMLNVLNKSDAKCFFQLIRKLSAKGMTIILLAHTNKYTDNEGKPIYEGTGDMRSDVDELIYLIPQKHSDGSMTVTTAPDKVRGSFEPITFNIDRNRNVSIASQAVDTALANQVQSELSNDQHVIDAIKEAIQSGAETQKEIIELCADVNVGERLVKKVLVKYGHDGSTDSVYPIFWNKAQGGKNSYIYSLSNC